MAPSDQNVHEVLLAPFLQLSTQEAQQEAYVLVLFIKCLQLIAAAGCVDLLSI